MRAFIESEEMSFRDEFNCRVSELRPNSGSSQPPSSESFSARPRSASAAPPAPAPAAAPPAAAGAPQWPGRPARGAPAPRGTYTTAHSTADTGTSPVLGYINKNKHNCTLPTTVPPTLLNNDSGVRSYKRPNKSQQLMEPISAEGGTDINDISFDFVRSSFEVYPSYDPVPSSSKVYPRYDPVTSSPEGKSSYDFVPSPSYGPVPSPSYDPVLSPCFDPVPSPTSSSYDPVPSTSYDPAPSSSEGDASYEPIPSTSTGIRAWHSANSDDTLPPMFRVIPPEYYNSSDSD